MRARSLEARRLGGVGKPAAPRHDSPRRPGKCQGLHIQHACGRVSYTTYHTQPTAEVYDPRQPQVLALLFWILEVGVCMDPVVIG